MRLSYRPLSFLVMGFVWVLLASLLGLALFLGMTTGRPYGQVARSLHVHGALIGGVMQIIVGLLLAGRERHTSEPVIFIALNLGTLGLLIGQAHGHFPLMIIAGIALLSAFVPLRGDLARQIRHSAVAAPMSYWFYGIAMVSLVGGLLAGAAVPLRLIPPNFVGQGRLVHIHLLTQGFVLLMIVGAMHIQFPAFLDGRLHSPVLGRMTFALLPLGFVVLLAGFLLANLRVQIAGGALLLIGALCYSYNIVRTWTDAGRPRKPASDLCLLATFFLVITIVCGILVSVNALEYPPFVPFGSLHLAAYTHLAFIGFMLLSLLGALTDLLPNLLAEERAASNKKRSPCEAVLTGIIGRWNPIQLWTLSVGTMSLAVVAALVWQYPLNAWPVKAAAWVGTLLLLTGLGLFAAKLVQLLAEDPDRASKS
ncbi:MAG: hypothetical protein EXR96_09775 [Nitrospiraceae bacterium]|nr:hypothetical protein [Nitrospiraceae bacterium]